jgi:hypothetical protein
MISSGAIERSRLRNQDKGCAVKVGWMGALAGPGAILDAAGNRVGMASPCSRAAVSDRGAVTLPAQQMASRALDCVVGANMWKSGGDTKKQRREFISSCRI